MKYRWGFLDANNNFSQCQPKVDDSTALDFSQESNEMFYRAKINGSLAFRFEFDDILSKGYKYEHRVVLQYYDADNDEWKEVWKGRFALTDCEIDYDTKTITVQPTTLDRYTTILDHLEDEYNLLKLLPTQQPVSLQVRPVVQVYSIGSSKVTNITTNGFYEQDVNSPIPDMLSSFFIYNATTPHNCYFALPHAAGDAHVCMPRGAVTIWLKDSNDEDVFFFAECGLDNTQYNNTVVHNAQIYKYDALNGIKTIIATIDAAFYFDGDFTTYIFDDGANTYAIKYNNADNGADIPSWYQIPVGYTFIKARANQFVSRVLLNTDADSVTWNGVTVPTVELNQTTDIAPIANYNKIAPIDITDIISEAEFQEVVSEFGIADNDGYFKKYAGGGYYYRPINISEWCLHSMWSRPVANGIDDYNKQIEIRDCYTLPSVIFRLMKKADVNINFVDNAVYSAFLFGNDNHITENAFYLCITPRSNIISSYYDTPALNAPITLQSVLNMLKSLFQVYWHIDENNYLHFEHVSYYDNGYNYTEDAPGLLVDLESELHTNTKNNKVFGQNKVKFDKQDMPAQITFSFDDTQTRPFDGYPINCNDAYIQQGSKEEKTIGKFDTDVDMILATPGEFSKEGFVLLASPYVGGVRAFNLGIKKNIKIIDEDGDAYWYSLQNYDCAVAYIAKYWWRYKLPCENVTINNEDTTAITTGRFKVQSVEFADSVMADILKDIDNCNKVIRTQQGDGHIKTISINLNSLVAKGNLLFNFIGRWYYLKGTAIGSSITIFVNGESTTIEVNANKFTYRYKEPISTLTFNAADVVSVNFADCDKLDNLTSCDAMFDGCEELIAVDFGGKTFGAVTTANNMFRGCVALTTLICPDSSTWKADLDLSDCPDFTLESFYDLIKFLYFYESGVHTITPNSTMWNALDGDTQTDLIAKATERGWTINMPAAYSITGQSAANTVYATINGSPVEIPVTAGQWQYDYNAAITSISFENDADVTDIDFSLSDGLAGVTSLNDAFKNCAGLTTVDFTNCDLSNVVSASDAFAGCIALYELIIPAGTWKPDVDLSDTVIMYAEMSNVISGLFIYSSGTHTITFNSTIWDALSVAQQQAIFDAAQLKWWTTNAVAVVYVVRGTSSNINGTETFNIQFINDGALSPSTAETITCIVDANGDWNFTYQGKKIYSLASFALNNTTILSVNFDDADEFEELADFSLVVQSAFSGCTNLTSASFKNQKFTKTTRIGGAFRNCTSLSVVNFAEAIMEYVNNGAEMFNGCTSIGSISFPKATFENLTDASKMFVGCTNLQTLAFPSATFNSLQVIGGSTGFGWVQNCINLQSITFKSGITMPSLTTCNNSFRSCESLLALSLPNVSFANCATPHNMFNGCKAMTTLRLDSATFASTTAANDFVTNMLALTDVVLPNSSTWNVALNFRYSPLTYNSMVYVANWLKDRSGMSALTCTFKATAWNALSSAEQSTIDGILSGKNWTRAIA